MVVGEIHVARRSIRLTALGDNDGGRNSSAEIPLGLSSGVVIKLALRVAGHGHPSDHPDPEAEAPGNLVDGRVARLNRTVGKIELPAQRLVERSRHVELVLARDRTHDSEQTVPLCGFP